LPLFLSQKEVNVELHCKNNLECNILMGIMKLNLHRVIPDYADYLKDESRLKGEAETISFPVSETEIRETISLFNKEGIPVTVQGGRTGITGGSVPRSGHILNLSRMSKVLGMRYDSSNSKYILKVQPGILLDNINNILTSRKADSREWDTESLKIWRQFCLVDKRRKFFFPPNPTETTASIGGMAANNASGSRSFLYGSVRKHIIGLKAILPDGSGIYLKRGVERAEGLKFALKTDSGQIIRGRLPDYTMPRVKNAAGFFAEKDMDLIDLFIGSEGTLGVITELELIISPMPPVIWGFMIFLPDEEGAVSLVRRLRDESNALTFSVHNYEKQVPQPAAIEYFDRESLELLKNQKLLNPAFRHLPEIKLTDVCALYVEFHANTDKEIESIAESIIPLVEKTGGNSDEIWVASNPDELKRLLDFRHAIPETVNMIIDRRRVRFPGITKLGTDMAVPDSRLETVMAMYGTDLTRLGLEYVKFGHIGNNHIHVNIMPRSKEEYRIGKDLYSQWAKKVVSMHGTVSAEHGIGKLKVELLKIMYGAKGLKEMQELKRIFDPKGLLNRGNDFDDNLMS